MESECKIHHHSKLQYIIFNFNMAVIMVPGAGLEPARYFYRWILSPLRLPVPPSRHRYCGVQFSKLN